MKRIAFISLFALFLLTPVYSQEVPKEKEKTWNDLIQQANTLSQQNKPQEAVDMAKDALKKAEEIFGANTREVAFSLSTLAYLYYSQGKYGEAEPLCEKSLEIEEQILGPSHLDVAAALSNLAEVYASEKKYKDAESLYKRALTIIENKLGPDHAYAGMILEKLSKLYNES
ncbi:MAG: tetratricopeptide repeat protein [Candidatus Omnitrophica bacterium]|nr:tetratricopeptide repeat protein [Candidatus Omnitrophota bacterium]